MQLLKKFNVAVVCGLVGLTIGSMAYASDTKTTKKELPISHAVYSCGGTDKLEVVYFDDKTTHTQYAVITQMNELIPMVEMATASGIGYKAINPDYSYKLQTKGKDATLYEKDYKVVLDCKLDD
ncbi:membrane-bound lysozyme inhibitor of c-type lysozyme MliC [Pasteurella langaaensis DSM 22999]|uniref:Membrane-bound lysozyme inhibitor of c-type lysozyme MliC n=1 Tax=Alitibacter langaaensis DSM 22999 TaxID=1122935 RepID=A0A2U0TAP2_9PAST|nr:MliC family protein [Pasteurella langaaensis]PVX40584.1 membrane-bound lysozyme inhibitor of c-type lysozyme MliC [Pasteurella langaaensis DSM 22999]